MAGEPRPPHPWPRPPSCARPLGQTASSAARRLPVGSPRARGPSASDPLLPSPVSCAQSGRPWGRGAPLHGHSPSAVRLLFGTFAGSSRSGALLGARPSSTCPGCLSCTRRDPALFHICPCRLVPLESPSSSPTPHISLSHTHTHRHKVVRPGCSQ